MKTALLLSLFLATTSTAAPIEIHCGDMKSGHAVTIEISPLERAVGYKTYVDGAETDSAQFRPTAGIYDRATLDFSGREFLQSDVWIHASYAQFLRINHLAGVTINLTKEKDQESYTLATFSSGYAITSGTELTEQAHSEFVGLPCLIAK